MQRAPAEPRKCRYCPRILAARGIVSHERKHEREAASAEQLAALAQAEITRGLNSLGFIGFTGDSLLPSNGIDDIQSANVGQPTNQEGVIHDLTDHAPPNRTWSPPPMVGVDSGPTQAIPDATPLEETRETAPEVPPPQRLASEAEDVVRQLGRVAEEDDICVEKHPRSGEGIKYYSYDDYSKQSSQPLPPPPTASQNSSTNETPKRMPWFPFQSRVDFLLAEFMQDLRLNAKEIDRLLDIVHMILSDPPGGFNLASAKHVASTWKIATESSDVTLVRKSLDDLDYAGEPVSIDVWVRPLWDWCLELVDNPDIVSQFHWNAEKISRHDGVEFVRFFNEPWTGNTWWEIQLQLPGDASPIFIVLYADKTKLSSFGTRKGYPVYVRCANLPANIRNGKGLAGGRLVGWLPILPEETDKAKKSSFINFKRIVWHKSFAKILESIKVYAKEGFWHKCGDGIWRRLFPIILILSADYEEMCMMSATRGHGSACPCPICLVPLDRLMDVTETFELRTTESMMAVYREAKDARLASEKEDILKKVGLRFVENCFWELAYTDVYPAQSFDRLHAYHSGVFKHLLNEFLAVFDSLSRPSRTSVEKSLKEFQPAGQDLLSIALIFASQSFPLIPQNKLKVLPLPLLSQMLTSTICATFKNGTFLSSVSASVTLTPDNQVHISSSSAFAQTVQSITSSPLTASISSIARFTSNILSLLLDLPSSHLDENMKAASHCLQSLQDVAKTVERDWISTSLASVTDEHGIAEDTKELSNGLCPIILGVLAPSPVTQRDHPNDTGSANDTHSIPPGICDIAIRGRHLDLPELLSRTQENLLPRTRHPSSGRRRLRRPRGKGRSLRIAGVQRVERTKGDGRQRCVPASQRGVCIGEYRAARTCVEWEVY
ncbi:hypothetical protein NMY22_g19198 [Coprinellus aureogranulatus]|nr:hypothetical protein NMY22_g19198 [Coprinellus aureogranulatus]